MAIATSAASNPRALRPGANFPRARFAAAGLRVRVVPGFAFAAPMHHKVPRQGADFNCGNVCDTVI